MHRVQPETTVAPRMRRQFVIDPPSAVNDQSVVKSLSGDGGGVTEGGAGAVVSSV